MGVCGWLHHFGGWTVLPGRIIIGAGWDTAGPIKCAVTCAGRASTAVWESTVCISVRNRVQYAWGRTVKVDLC